MPATADQSPVLLECPNGNAFTECLLAHCPGMPLCLLGNVVLTLQDWDAVFPS